jgi:histidinol-phosphate aminotransferase
LAGLLNRVRQPFNVNAIGQAAAVAALDDTDFMARARATNATGLRQLSSSLIVRGLEIVPSEANFLLVRVGDGARVFAELQRRGVIVRPMKPYGMPEWVRVTVGAPAQNERFLAALDQVFAT